MVDVEALYTPTGCGWDSGGGLMKPSLSSDSEEKSGTRGGSEG